MGTKALAPGPALHWQAGLGHVSSLLASISHMQNEGATYPVGVWCGEHGMYVPADGSTRDVESVDQGYTDGERGVAPSPMCLCQVL